MFNVLSPSSNSEDFFLFSEEGNDGKNRIFTLRPLEEKTNQTGGGDKVVVRSSKIPVVSPVRGWQFILLFTTDFLHPTWLFGISEPSTVV